MKYLSLHNLLNATVLVSVLVAMSACKKEDIAPPRQEVAFVKYYGHVLDQEGVDVKVLETDGVREYLIFGSTYSFNTKKGRYRDFYLVKADSLGNEIWSVKFGNDTDDQLIDKHKQQERLEKTDFDEIGRRIVVLSDGSGYLLAGTRQRIETDENGVDVPKEKRMVFYMVGPDGALITTPVVHRFDYFGNNNDSENMFSDELFDIDEIVDSSGSLGYIITGSTTNVDTLKPDYQNYKTEDKYDIYTTRLNPDLSIDWDRVYGFPGEDKGTSVETVNDGDFVVVGTSQTKNDVGDGFHKDFIFITYKRVSGNVANQDRFGSEATELQSVASCYNAENDIITAIGHYELQVDATPALEGQIVLIQIDSDLDLIKSSSPVLSTGTGFANNNTQMQARGASIHLLPDNEGFVISATVAAGIYLGPNDPQFASDDICIAKISTELVLVDPEKDQMLFGYNQHEVAGAVVPVLKTFAGTSATELESLVFTGTFNLGTNNMMGLVKVNQDLSADPDGLEDDVK